MPNARGLRLLVAACAAALAVPAAASAATSQESTFQDDNKLIFNTTAGTVRTLDDLHRLGVDRIRVSVFWATVAPDPRSRTKPSFDPGDPAQYPAGAWDRYDQVVRLARQRGIAVNFDITSPAPLWATGANPARDDIANTWKPDPQEFAKFVEAVGTRYSGTYAPPAVTRAVPREAAPPLCVLLNACPPAPPAPKGEVLPRVDYWSVWNEPNQGGWLTPQWDSDGSGGMIESSPRIYRSLVDAAWTGLGRSGHGSDTILVGETAPKGLDTQTPTSAMKSLHFIRQLYCVDDNLQPYSGDEARKRGCPEAPGDPAAFVNAHPGLFDATGFSHHPYELYMSPTAKPHDKDFATIANLPTLTGMLGRIFALYGRAPSGPPIYLTEFGYNTMPPNPAGVSLTGQAAYLNTAEFIARTNPMVRTLTQFLLVDDAPRPGRNGVQAGYGATFQTGLRFLSGKAKPSYAAYELPLVVPQPTVRRGGPLRVWGLVRPARQIGKRQAVSIEQRTGGAWRILDRAVTHGGVIDDRVRVRRSGSVRLTWRDTRRKRVTTVVSRTVAVRVTGR